MVTSPFLRILRNTSVGVDGGTTSDDRAMGVKFGASVSFTRDLVWKTERGGLEGVG